MARASSDVKTDLSEAEIVERIENHLSGQDFSRTGGKNKNLWRKGFFWTIFVRCRITDGVAHVEVWNYIPVPGFGSFVMYFLNSRKLQGLLQEIEDLLGGKISVQPASAPAGLKYAGFWRRFGAMVVDGLIFMIINSLFLAIIIGISRTDSASGFPSARNAVMMATSISSLLLIIVSWLYYTIMESSAKQATLGKLAFRIKVVNAQGERISFGKANARFWSKFVSALILGIGFLLAGFTAKKQALHDLMANTLIVRN